MMADLALANNIKIEGVKDKEIVQLIYDQIISKDKYNYEDSESISNEFLLEQDKATIKIILHSFGYFDAEVGATVKEKVVIFEIKLNQRYKFDDLLLKYLDEKDFKSGLKVGEVFALINIQPDTYTTTKEIAKASLKIRDFLQGYGFAFVEVQQPNLEIDKKNKKIKAIYSILLNRKTIVDKTIIKIKSKKDPKLLEPFIRNRIPWKDGDTFDAKKVELFKEDLMNSGIFSVIDVKLAEPTPEKNNPQLSHTAAIVQVEEALLRNIEVGLKYGTTEKLGTHLSWTHYNIDGKGSKLTGLLDTSNLFNAKNRDISTQLKYSVYDLFYKRQELKSRAGYTIDKELSYNVRKISAESVLWQDFGKYLKVGAGACFENAITTDLIENPNGKKTKFDSFGFPIGVNLDTTDVFLDPQKGVRCTGMATPYVVGNNSLTIVNGKASFYLPISKNALKNLAVLAFYTSAGTILNSRANNIPRDKMFFAGGANSIRGYGHQKLGASTNENQPYGGKSAFEVGIEPRIKVSENVGIAVFFEGGNVYSSRVPNPIKKLLWGYGLGIRYYTPLGPIRLDIAFPTRRRKTPDGKKRIDSAFQVYISIGQAF